MTLHSQQLSNGILLSLAMEWPSAWTSGTRLGLAPKLEKHDDDGLLMVLTARMGTKTHASQAYLMYGRYQLG